MSDLCYLWYAEIAMSPSKKTKLASEKKSSQKTKSAPNPVATKLLNALKKNKAVETVSMKKKTVSCPQNSSPQSVKKKAISSNLKNKISKKRKRADEPVITKQEGLKLLKRGPVTMHRIVRRKMLGMKYTVSFNSKGEPYGSAAGEMQSYIGVLARTKAPIWYDSWKKVPKERKNKIFDCVQVIF